ncbi:MAG: insulinase family protein [Verrucomicrobiota bacterium]
MRIGRRGLRSDAVGCVFALIACLVLTAGALASAKPWPHERSRLEPDERISWGKLENGFRYALLPHDHSPERISMRLVVEVGSLDERESERGLTHFVEHMGFEGTTHFEQGQLFSFFQKLGMSFGGDVTAFTSYDHTIYHLELPRNQESLIQQSLLLYRDFADGIVFDPARIEKEREIILREKQARDTPSSRIQLEGLEQVFDGTMLPERSPIGLERVIRNVSREELLAFYREWYRPDLMTLFVVGDFDPEQMETMIEDQFASLVKPKGKPTPRVLGKLAKPKLQKIKIVTTEGVDRLQIDASRAWEERRSGDSERLRKMDFQRDFTTEMINQRCRRAIDGIHEDFADYEVFLGYPMAQLKISVNGDALANGVVWIDRILRQAGQFGFGEDEIESQKVEWRKGNSKYVARFNSAEPQELIGELVYNVLNDRVQLSPEETQEMYSRFLDEFSSKDAKKAFRDVWKRKQFNYLAAGDLFFDAPDRWLGDLLRLEQQYKVSPYVAEKKREMFFTPLGMEGTVVEGWEIDGIDAKTFRFSNNALLTFMKTPYAQGEANVMVKVGGGLLDFRTANPASHALAISSMFRSGTPYHDTEEIYSFMRDTLGGFTLSNQDHDAFTFQAQADEEGIENFLKVVSEFLLRPDIEEDAFEVAKSKSLQGLRMEPDGLMAGYRELNRMLFPDMPHFHFPTISEMESAQREDSAKWLEEAFLEGYLEVVIVGDLDEERAKGIVSRTLGALPKRAAEKQDFSDERNLKLDIEYGTDRIEYMSGKGENAVAVIAWTILDDAMDTTEADALYVLCQVLENRLHEVVREKLGQSYAPRVDYESYFAYKNFKRVRVEVDCLKEDAEPLLQVLSGMIEELASENVTQDELDRAINPMEDSFKQAWRDNSFLAANILYSVNDYPGYVERSLELTNGSLRKLTPEDLRKAAAQYLRSENSLAVAIVPRGAEGVSEAMTRESDGAKPALARP